MALPSVPIILPIVVGAAIVVAIAAYVASRNNTMNESHSYKSQDTYSPPTTWSDIKSEHESRRRKKKKCPICLEGVEELDDKDVPVFVNVKCGHVVCGNCISQILSFHNTRGDSVNPRCPLCRTFFTRKDLQRIVW